MLGRLYPLRGLPRQGQIWSWISFDVANQSFTLLINTLLFSIFFTQVVVTDPAMRNTWWNITYATSMLLTVILSPIFGAMSDARAWKKECLVVSGLTCGILTCCFGFIQPSQLWLALLLYIPANLAYSIGENFLGSFLPELSPREAFGRVSGFSWGIAYFAALIILLLTAAVMINWKLEDPNQWRPFFVAAGVWFIVFAIPTLVFLREQSEPPAAPRVNVIKVAFLRISESIRNVGGFRDLSTLLIASLFYGTGMSVVVFFASIIAQDFGFTGGKLVAFVAVITVSGVVGTLIPMLIQDRWGHKKTTLSLLGLWMFTTLALAFYAWMRTHVADPAAYPIWPMWVLGNLLGFGLGSLGSANRAFVGFLTPVSRTGEVFGLWGLVFKFSAVCTIPFGVAKDKLGTPAALLVLFAFIVVGLVITLFIDERRGRDAARALDGETDDTVPPPPAHGPLLSPVATAQSPAAP
jgi:UMF1 family MFS transporter